MKQFSIPNEVKHCIGGDGEKVWNCLHRIKKTVDKEWPDDMEELPQQTRVLKELLRHGKDEKNILTTR